MEDEEPEDVKANAELKKAFEGDTASDVLNRLRGSAAGRAFFDKELATYQQEFGYKAIWSHEFVFPTWKENPAPIIEAIRGYLETDYDYQKTINTVKKDLESAVGELLDGVKGDQLQRLKGALDLCMSMSPLTPDHHFYIDQGTNARLRLVLVAIGRRLEEEGVLHDPEDTIFLQYNELRRLLGDTKAFTAFSGVQAARRARGCLRCSASRVGGNRNESGSRLPLQRSLGLPRQVLSQAPRLDRRHQRAGRVAWRGGGTSTVCALTR